MVDGEKNRFQWRPFEARRKRRKWILLSGGLLVGLCLLVYFFFIPGTPPPSPVVSDATRPETAREPQLHAIEGDVKERSTLFKS